VEDHLRLKRDDGVGDLLGFAHIGTNHQRAAAKSRVEVLLLAGGEVIQDTNVMTALD